MTLNFLQADMLHKTLTNIQFWSAVWGLHCCCCCKIRRW